MTVDKYNDSVMKKNLTVLFFITLVTISCRVHKTRQIIDARASCISADSVHADIDSLKYFLHNARGKFSIGYLIKGATNLSIEYKNGHTRTIQILWGGQPTFHFTHGRGKNIWYTFSDTIVNNQWRAYFKNLETKCKEN